MKSYRSWCRMHKVTHGHCPSGCPPPQAEAYVGSTLYCGDCLIKTSNRYKIMPCHDLACLDFGWADGRRWVRRAIEYIYL